jgi:hypothetical protein
VNIVDCLSVSNCCKEMIKIMEGGMPIASDLSRGRNQQRMFDRRIASGYRFRNDRGERQIASTSIERWSRNDRFLVIRGRAKSSGGDCFVAKIAPRNDKEKGRVHHTTEIAGFVMTNASLPLDIRQLFADQAILDT